MNQLVILVILWCLPVLSRSHKDGMELLSNNFETTNDEHIRSRSVSGRPGTKGRDILSLFCQDKSYS